MTPPRAWLTSAEVRARLRLSPHALYLLMADSAEAGIVLPATDIGRGKRRFLRWNVAKLDSWFEEVSAWLASTRSEGGGGSGGKSAGAIPTGGSARGPSGRTTRPRSSGEKSKTSSGAANGGRLVTFARSLISETSQEIG
jgi:hypothetical protein